jgi:hypothetical protein
MEILFSFPHEKTPEISIETIFTELRGANRKK